MDDDLASQLFRGNGTPVRAISRLVMAGARAIGLAVQVRVHASGPLAEREPAVALALGGLADAVLKDWDVVMSPKTEAADAAARPAPVPAPTEPQEDELQWPPPEPLLDRLYMENFYHVREAITSIALYPDDVATALVPTEKLRFMGPAQWDHVGRCWLMRMTPTEKGPALNPSWIRSKDVRVGDEIPEFVPFDLDQLPPELP